MSAAHYAPENIHPTACRLAVAEGFKVAERTAFRFAAMHARGTAARRFWLAVAESIADAGQLPA